MKCPKCGSEVKPNYKFCSKCGQPIADAESVSVKSINNDNVSSAKAHQNPPEEPEPPALRSNVTDNLDIVKGKAIWNIGPGQLARRVSEAEFAQLDNVKGVVIQEGVTAVITVDGQMIGMLSGGYYVFETEEVKAKAEAKADEEEKEDKKQVVQHVVSGVS